jgi:hypothetical protein
MTTAVKSALFVTAGELSEIATAEKRYADAKKKISDAETQVKFLRLQLAEKVLGVKTEDELKQLGPDQVLKRMTKRFEAGDWKPERGAPEFQFKKTNAGRYPSWSQIYAEDMGETAAARIRTETPVTFSYAVEVSTL